MKKRNIVKESRDFSSIIKTGKFVKDKNLVIYYKEKDNTKYRFGISVGKKIGKAVTRNKYKRRMRNIIDNHEKLYSNSLDYIIIVRKNCLLENYQQIEESFVELLNKLNKQLEKGARNEEKDK